MFRFPVLMYFAVSFEGKYSQQKQDGNAPTPLLHVHNCSYCASSVASKHYQGSSFQARLVTALS